MVILSIDCWVLKIEFEGIEYNIVSVLRTDCEDRPIKNRL